MKETDSSSINPVARPRRKRREGPATPLTRQQIVSCALALVDREGLKSLSMRKLGAELGVDPMAVYYHIPNKESLLDAIVEAVMADIDLSVDIPTDPPVERILYAARAYRDAMMAHVNALPIILTRGPVTPIATRPVNLLIGILRDAGLPVRDAVAGMNAIAAATRGIVGMTVSQVHYNKKITEKVQTQEFDLSLLLAFAMIDKMRLLCNYPIDLGRKYLLYIFQVNML